MTQPVVSLRIFKETDIHLLPSYRRYKQMVSWLNQNGLQAGMNSEELLNTKIRYISLLCALDERTHRYDIPLGKALIEVNDYDMNLSQAGYEKMTAKIGVATFSDISINPEYVKYKLTDPMVSVSISELNTKLKSENKPSIAYAQVLLPTISPIESSLKESGFVAETSDYPTYTNKNSRETSLIKPANLDMYQNREYLKELSSVKYEDTKQAICAGYINMAIINSLNEQSSGAPSTPTGQTENQ